MTTNNYFLNLHQKDQTVSFAVLAPLITIGTAPEVTINLTPGSADERHCRIEKKDSGHFFVKDLRSTTGTFLNGARIIEAFLVPGDVLTIGQNEFSFQNQQEINQASINNPFLKSKNPQWAEVLKNIPNLARTDFPVLILGPSGSGKEIIAKQVHEYSHRSYGPYVTVNCSALTETLIESELFGHIKGSFTGAINDRKGAFESARGGTLFLDEIGDLPISLQAKLLRALENNEIRPVGSDKTIKTDVRVIAATHQNLFSNIKDKTFRSDLFYRINVITIQTPSLLERMEDFDDLFFSMCRDARVRFSHKAIQLLKNHGWPGNIRELKNVISRGSALYKGQTIEDVHLSQLVDRIPKNGFEFVDNPLVLSGKTNLIKEMEKQMILNRLAINRGNQRRTAVDLGIPKSTLHDRIKSYKIDLEQIATNADVKSFAETIKV